MKPYTILVAAFVGLAYAAPAAEADRDHQLIFYTDTNYKGRSESITVREHVCSKLRLGAENESPKYPSTNQKHPANLNRKVDDKVSSIVNPDRIKCHFYV